MRLLADENVPAATVRALQEAGHDVAWVMTTAPGTGDGDVLGYPRTVASCSFTFPCLDRATLGTGSRS
jgi:predicted nuclease of predicted toxin-antitoxin system